MRYWSGLATGICALALLLFFVLTLQYIPDQAALYGHVEGATLPPLTILVISPAWRWTVPAVFVTAVLALNLAKINVEIRRTIGLGATAALLVFALLLTHWALFLPVFELAGDIRGG